MNKDMESQKREIPSHEKNEIVPLNIVDLNIVDLDELEQELINGGFASATPIHCGAYVSCTDFSGQQTQTTAFS